jgi:glycosyltransferase 2 family protein
LNRKRLFNLLKVAVSIVLIVVILRSVDLNALWNVLRHANPWYLAAALVISMAGVFVRAVRWQILVHDQGVPASLGELAALYFISFLFTNVLPSGIGGDAVRAYELSRTTQRGAEVVSTVLVDRFMGLFALQAIALIALIFSWWMIPLKIVAFTVVIFGVSLLIAWVVSSKPLWSGLARRVPLFNRFLAIKQVNSLVNSLQGYSRSALVRAFGVGLAFNVLLITMNILLGTALGAHLLLAYYMIFVPITSIVLVAPISFAGLGVREGAYVFLFTQAGVAQEVALSLSLMVYVIGTVGPGVIGGVIYLLRGTRSYRMAEEG